MKGGKNSNISMCTVRTNNNNDNHQQTQKKRLESSQVAKQESVCPLIERGGKKAKKKSGVEGGRGAAERFLSTHTTSAISTPKKKKRGGRYSSFDSVPAFYTVENRTYLMSTNGSIPYFEPSRPSPLSLIPPNGAHAVESAVSFTPTMPYRRAAATRY